MLRLFDEQGAREDETFEGSWRTFLHAWNLLQFHEGITVTSSELIAQYWQAYETMQPAKAAESPDQESSGKGIDPDFEALLNFATEASKPLLEGVYDAGLAWPELDYELPADSSECGPAADLAWPALRVAVLAEAQLEDRGTFESQGWTVLTYPLEIEELVAVLRERDTGTKESGS